MEVLEIINFCCCDRSVWFFLYFVLRENGYLRYLYEVKYLIGNFIDLNSEILVWVRVIEGKEGGGGWVGRFFFCV